jgi:hypothetical protein
MTARGRARGKWKTVAGSHRPMTPERWAAEGVRGTVWEGILAGVPLSMQVQPDGHLLVHARGGIKPEKIMGLLLAPRVLRGTPDGASAADSGQQ